MKKTKLILPIAGLAAVAAAVLILPRALSSAEASPSTQIPAEHGAEPWSFKEGRGILLSDPARRALSVETASVESGAMNQDSVRHSAQIYRTAAESAAGQAAASLWLSPAEDAAVAIGQSVEVLHGDVVKQGKVSAKREGMSKGSPVEVLLEIRDDAKALRLGDFVTARLGSSAPSREATFVPSSAVVESVRGTFVYALNGESYLRTPVKLGTRSEDHIEIVDGLFEGDEVVTSGAKDLWLVELQAVNGGKGCADGH